MEKTINIVIWIAIAYVVYSLVLKPDSNGNITISTDILKDLITVTVDNSSNDVNVINSFNHTDVITGTTP